MPPLSWLWLQVKCNHAAEALPPARNRYFPLGTGLRIHKRSSKLVSSWPSLQPLLHRKICWDFTFLVLVCFFPLFFFSHACHEEGRRSRDEKEQLELSRDREREKKGVWRTFLNYVYETQAAHSLNMAPCQWGSISIKFIFTPHKARHG